MPKSSLSLPVRLAASAAVFAAVAFTAATASAQPPAHGDQCFFAQNVNNFEAPDDHTVYIRVGARDVYRLDLMSGCSNLTFRTGIGFQSTPGGDPWICSPLQATIVYHENGIPYRCEVSAIHKLTPAEVAALPPRNRP